MSKFILIDGDIVNFMGVFGKAIVYVRPGILKASGKSTLKRKKICIDRDEKKVSVLGCTYYSPPSTIPGVGTLVIKSLGVDQKAKKTFVDNKKVLLKGTTFIAELKVETPAQQPPVIPGQPPIPDPISQYIGRGYFKTTNTKWKGE